MSSTPFRFVQRRTTVSGRVPVISSLLTGEIYLQVADGTIYFRDAHQNKLHTVITDASGFGLNKLKFSGAVSGDIPLWDGSKIIPYNTGNFVFNSDLDTSSFVTTGQTGSFITTGQTGNFGSTTVYQNGSGLNILNTGYGSNSIQQTGSSNYSSGDYSVTIGSGNSAEKDFSFALGQQAKTSQFGEFAFSNGSFYEKGDSQYSFVMARGTTANSSPTFLKINNSDKLTELELGATVFFTANIVGAGGDKYISNEIRGVIKRSISSGSQISFLNSPTKSIYALYPNGSNYSTNVTLSTSDNSLKIECVGDAVEKMIWFAKIDLIKIKEIKNIYFYPSVDADWFTDQNWYSDEQFLNHTDFPKQESIVYVNSPNPNVQPFVDIDNQFWITPEIINTLNVTNVSGLKIISTIGSQFTGTVIGNVTFEGASPA
jgi:hypothetical protein